MQRRERTDEHAAQRAQALLGEGDGPVIVDLDSLVEQPDGAGRGMLRWLRLRRRGRVTPEQAARVEATLRDAGISVFPALGEAPLPRTVVLARPAHPPSARRLWLARARPWAVRSITGIGLVASVVGLVTWADTVTGEGRPGPPRLVGELNVVVTALAGTTRAERRTGRDLALSYERVLRRSLQASLRPRPGDTSLDIEVAGPDDVPAPPVNTPERWAAKLIERTNADLVLLGRIRTVGGVVTVEPSLVISPDRLRGAEELAGRYPLGLIRGGGIPLDDDIAARRRLGTLLVRRLSSLGSFVTGLTELSASQFAAARTYFDDADDPGGWPSGQGVALVRMFQGNASGKLGDLVGAERAFRSASALRPGWSRPLFGLTEVGFHSAHRGCGADASETRLRRALARYTALASAAKGDELGVRALRIRSLLGSARADLCLSEALLADRRLEAQRGLNAVLREIGKDRNRFAAEAAEAHAALGLVLLPRAGRDPEAERRALAEYTKARSLTDDVARERLFDAIAAGIERRTRAEEGPSR